LIGGIEKGCELVEVFAHAEDGSRNTLSEISRLSAIVEPNHFFGCYAYATQSGVYSFEQRMGDQFWDAVATRWLLGIDYGRTQPEALRRLSGKPNSEIRIHDGTWIIGRNGFIPRRDFHPKAAILSNLEGGRAAVVVGSGNFSSNGLHRSIEAGSSLHMDSEAAQTENIGQFRQVMEDLWETASPLNEVLTEYDENWQEEFSWASKADEVDVDGTPIFWIEAGYVTQNRGPDRPGNQIDFPRGMNRFFGFNAPDNQPLNSVIGEVRMQTAVGDAITRNLRLGNNSMEKMSLPIPETHGFDNYDGKILVFERDGTAFNLYALENEDFSAAFGSKIANVQSMGSGRQYGIVIT